MSPHRHEPTEYLERQTRDALRALGWVVVRARGALEPVDLIALHAARPPLAVVCHDVDPNALKRAAAHIGARAVVAVKLGRGIVELQTPGRNFIQELRVRRPREQP